VLPEAFDTLLALCLGDIGSVTVIMFVDIFNVVEDRFDEFDCKPSWLAVEDNIPLREEIAGVLVIVVFSSSGVADTSLDVFGRGVEMSLNRGFGGGSGIESAHRKYPLVVALYCVSKNWVW